MVAGVPQGTISGPLLFIIYSLDLPNFVSSASVYAFADDTSLLCKGRNNEELRVNCKNAFNDLFTWVDNNLLQINVGKTKTLPFFHEGINLEHNGENLELVNNFKLVGIWIDSS